MTSLCIIIVSSVGIYDARVSEKAIWREKDQNIFVILCFGRIRFI
jgi:hypothetical protein